ncbi:MAG TPA: hypothetical protein VFZ68_06190, partial [Acidimicrobiales bacterium]
DMRTKIRVALAATAVCALTIGTAAPAGAQEEPAALGFAVDKTQAPPGALVLGKADAGDVAEHCVTDLEAFQSRFEQWLFDGPFDGDEEGVLFDRIFPDGEIVFENYVQLAWALTGFTAVGIGANIEGAAETALPQTFVMTFADIATQEPVGERGNFDPNTGDGSVVVPDIEPGNWAVAAACVGPSFNLDVVEAGLQANAEFLEELGVPVEFGSPEFNDFVNERGGFVAFLQEIGPTLLEPHMVPDAFGAVLFCILDAEGNCPADEEPAPPPGEPVPPPSEEPAAAQPVVAAPTFTG